MRNRKEGVTQASNQPLDKSFPTPDHLPSSSGVYPDLLTRGDGRAPRAVHLAEECWAHATRYCMPVTSLRPATSPPPLPLPSAAGRVAHLEFSSFQKGFKVTTFEDTPKTERLVPKWFPVSQGPMQNRNPANQHFSGLF